jgi:hypothetical protein
LTVDLRRYNIHNYIYNILHTNLFLFQQRSSIIKSVSSDLPSDLPTEAMDIMVYSTNICTITIIILLFEKLLLF